jgi:hypothetical protein
LIDEHLCHFQVHFPFSGLRVWNLAEKESGILRLHQDEFDKSLSHFSRIRAGLNFRHTI